MKLSQFWAMKYFSFLLLPAFACIRASKMFHPQVSTFTVETSNFCSIPILHIKVQFSPFIFFLFEFRSFFLVFVALATNMNIEHMNFMTSIGLNGRVECAMCLCMCIYVVCSMSKTIER